MADVTNLLIRTVILAVLSNEQTYKLTRNLIRPT